jgi:phosphatidylglycerol:prolipoprotein diacylglycerol transferase
MYPQLWTLTIAGYSIPISTYGVLMALGFIISIHLGFRRGDELEVDSDLAVNYATLVVITSIVSSRVTFILTEWQDFKQNPQHVFSVWNAGSVWYGGLIGAIIGSYIFARMMPNWVFLEFSDEIVPLIPIGHAVGRLGCFFSGCCYGVESHLPWACTFVGQTVPRHPTQAYEAVGLLAIFFICYRLVHRPHRTGSITMAYLGYYGLLRFVVELYRGDERGPVYWGSLSISQVVSVFLMAWAAISYAVVWMKEPIKPPLLPLTQSGKGGARRKRE